MSTIATLANQLIRISEIKGLMTWKDVWNNTEQYYLNDVVISPANAEAYVLVGRTTLLGGVDPSLSMDWRRLSAASGVQSVSAGSGISVSGTATAPVVSTQPTVYTGTITSGVNVGDNAFTLGGDFANIPFAANSTYLFGCILTIDGPTAGGNAYVEIGGQGGGFGAVFPFIIPVVGGGDIFEITLTGTMRTYTAGGSPLFGKLVLSSGAFNASYNDITLIKLV